MDVNDDARCLEERGALTSIASKLAPTDGQQCSADVFPRDDSSALM
ncbi:hypothetical protein PS838_03577 [Pseudomonas fluorescens]|nr:hypothetical protein PS838_03577 [Pseudomonas fluorescens]